MLKSESSSRMQQGFPEDVDAMPAVEIQRSSSIYFPQALWKSQD